jgi:hypothetical protein
MMMMLMLMMKRSLLSFSTFCEWQSGAAKQKKTSSLPLSLTGKRRFLFLPRKFLGFKQI